MRFRDTFVRTVVAAVLIAAPAAAFAGRGGDHRADRDPAAHVERMLDRAGADDATRAKVQQVIDERRAASDELQTKMRDASRSLRELLGQEAPDEAAVMAQADAVGALETELHKHKLGTLLKVRAQLTPGQRQKLAQERQERREAARAACAEDLVRLCPDGGSDGEEAGLQCLRGREEEVAAGCKEVLEKRARRRGR